MEKVELNIQIKNITQQQKIAIESMLAVWGRLGRMGSTRWVSFLADGEGDFRPNIKIDGKNPIEEDCIKTFKSTIQGRDYVYEDDIIFIDFQNVK